MPKSPHGPLAVIDPPGKDCDFVSRFFAPAKGVNEDPVTDRPIAR
jgi:predicted PhzF superfamily epimerase YddE/YHI9